MQRELWARAAGRCQFRGCNKLLFKDALTQQRSNLCVISHVVSYSPNGPRGDAVRSPALATDLRNLMLTCREHGKVIDDRARVDDYPEDLLLDFKREHESRIRIVTGYDASARTHVLIVEAAVGGRPVHVDESDAYRAILPRYPAEEDALRINLGDLALKPRRHAAWTAAAEAITDGVHQILRRRSGARRVQTLSVFALAPIPLLVHLGTRLGDLQHVELYQRHRRGQTWRWPEDEEADVFFETRIRALERAATEGEGGESDTALVLSVSGRVTRRHVVAALGDRARVYDLAAIRPGLDFLSSRTRLEVFGYEFRRILTAVRGMHGPDHLLHLFAAVPAPIAIEIGRALRSVDPPVLVYDWDAAGRAYTPVLTVNHAER
jgi:hypothetical protein